MSTPILPLAVWAEGSNQARIPANDNSLRLEALSREIISQAVTAQPGSPADGDTYIIASTHTGAQWSTFDPEDIAIYRGGTWYAWAPVEGIVVNVAGSLFKYDGGNWTAASTAGVSSVNGATGAVTLADLQETGLNVDACGFRGVPINSQSGNYTTVAADAGKAILHPNGGGSGDTFTIDSNANVAYEIGAAITFINMDSNALSIAITSDTLNLAGAGTTGTRTLAQYGIATAIKVTTTGWLISGTNLT